MLFMSSLCRVRMDAMLDIIDFNLIELYKFLATWFTLFDNRVDLLDIFNIIFIDNFFFMICIKLNGIMIVYFYWFIWVFLCVF
jgi:hypothetical protein